ncbi:hypothetical protein [Defluviitalea phaphyphila]|uniref:hypothetical protein n=1 Tax=Defluviitalea phaphyphila TaxID=1473580 RepID=UPI000731426C|nr:hypothetical protein [Defluviitalea phaphyphila]
MLKFIQYIKNKLTKGYKRCYIIHSNTSGKFYICRVLNIYDSEEEAIDNLTNLLNHNINEECLLSNFSKRQEL